MKKSLVILFAAVAFLASCQMSDIIPQMSKELKVFTGTLENDATRVALVADGDIYHVTWTLGDRIWVNDDYEFTATLGDVTTTYFAQDTTGDRPDDPPTAPYKAYWPSNISRGLPGVQNYLPNSIEFIPMAAESSDEILPFKNLVGLLKLNIKTGDTGIKVKSIVITADQGLSGEFTIEDSKAVVTGTNGVTLNCGEGVEIGADPVPFLVSVPANTYTGMTVKVYTTDGKVASVKMKSGASFTVERSKVYAAEFPFNGFVTVEGVGGSALLPSGPDFNATLKNLAYNTEGLDCMATDETEVTRIVFNTLSAQTDGIEIQDVASEKPIYMVYDKSSGVVNVNTPAETLVLPEDASYMFAYLGALKSIDNMKCLNTENVTSFQCTFCYVGLSNRELRHIDLSSFRTPNLINTRSMFNGCRNLEAIDVSNFDFSQDTSMGYMFQYCINLTDLNLGDNFTTENVMNMQGMFRDCNSLPSLDLSHFKTDNVERMDYMFYGCESAESIDCSAFNTEMVERMDYMFGYCKKLVSVNLKSFDTENCSKFNHMFLHCESLPTVDLSSFNTENALDLGNFFWHCYSLASIDVSNFSFESATNARSFFNRCYALETVDLSMIDGKGSALTTAASIGYFFYAATSLHEMNFGELFMFNQLPNTPFSEKGTAYDLRCGSKYGAITIYCDQDVCDYWARSGLRWLEHGYITGGSVDPIHTTFKHYKTGVELFPAEWPAD